MLRLILDSGAYSAWTKQEKINVESYADFCLANLDCFDHIVNLDVIPGKVGMKGVDLEATINESVREGWRNYRYLVSRGIPKNKLLHVFHQEEDFIWLERMVKRLDYIGLSPANDRNTKEKMVWLDQCMNYVLNKEGLPIRKLHGFGVTSIPLMMRYPWYSVDSASWVIYSRYGIILIPKLIQDEYRYDIPPLKVFVSTKSPKKYELGKHFDTFTLPEKRYIFNEISAKEFKMGISEINEEGKEVIIEEGLSNNHALRDRFNMLYHLDVEKTKNKNPVPFTFSSDFDYGFGSKGAEVDPIEFSLKIFFAGNFPQLKDPELENACMEEALKETPVYRRLVSYYFEDSLSNIMEMRRNG